MNNHIKRSVAGLVLLALVLTGITGVFAQESGALIRFVHAIPQAPAVDIYTNGQLTIQNLDYGQASGYVNVPAGEHRLTVTATGDTAPLWEQPVNPTAGAALTLVAAPDSPPAFLVYQDDLSPLPLGKARFAAIHAVAEAPGVDIALADGQVAIPSLQFGQPAGSLDLDTGFVYEFVVVPGGETPADALVVPDPLALTSGTSYVLVVYGPASAPTAFILTAPTSPQTDGGLMRLAHGVAGAPAVDVYLDDTLAAAALDFGEMTEHVAVPAGSYDAVLKVAGTDQTVLSAVLTVISGDAFTAAALGTAEDLSIQVVGDNVVGMDAAQARLNLLNGIPGSSLTAALEDGTFIVGELGFGEASGAVSIAPSAQSITLTVSGDDVSGTAVVPVPAFYGGVYYNLLAVSADGQLQLVTASTGVAQGIASAPGAASAAVSVEPTVPTIELPEVQPVIAMTELPTARPAVNPGVNLQLRQYPDPDALSLGLAPSDAVLTVNGRAGAPAALPGVQPPAEEYVDPASLLERNQDLAPADTWLNVTYFTPDGGSITAWVNAQFLNLSDAAGQRVRLADLPTVPVNQPGQAVNTGITPPPIPVDRVVATVFNLNPGVNLNIRRTPTTDGEVLARVTNGTVTEFLSVLETQDWAFVRYSPPEGGSITGWVNTLYIQYTLNGRPIDYEGMDEKDLLVISDGSERGEVAASIAPIVRPTVDPLRDAVIAQVLLDPGSNLNLRRRPDINAEVLVQIPSGSQVVVSGRTGDGNWLQVSFEGAVGWIAARTETAVFVRLTLNGKSIEISEVDIITDEPDTTVATPQPQVPDAQPTLPVDAIAIIVNDPIVQMTGSPGGSADSLPIIVQGQLATLLFTDGQFSYIELPNGIRGWVPAGAVRPR